MSTVGRFRILPLVLAALWVGACSVVPVDIGRALLPGAGSEYRTAKAAFDVLIERHVDRPGSQQLLVGAMDAVDAQLTEDGNSVKVERPQLTGAPQSDFAKFAEALDEVIGRAATADRTVLERVATEGMATAMNECHTYYLDPDRAKTFNQPPSSYSGIGATISATRPTELPEISSVFPKSPAERAGVRAGDRIRSVDGTEVLGFTAQEVANRIRGPESTTVTLVLVRPSGERTVPIVRATLTPPLVSERTYDGAIGSVRVSAFNGDVTRQTADAVQRLAAQGTTSFILDLRDNPGGDLSAAVDVASIFVKGVLVNQVGRDGQRQSIRTNDRLYSGAARELVVLVNERSASGSEIVAAGIQANGAGTVIGTKTAGCVGIGQPREMPDGGLLLVTLARMQHATTGEDLNGQGRGVTPDRIVRADPDASADAQVDAAITFLRAS
ncbi:MAG: S41 family peptidase [Candidatus Limnocylindria bacterium]